MFYEVAKGKSQWRVDRYNRSYTSLWLECLEEVAKRAGRFADFDTFIKECRYDTKSGLYLLADDEVMMKYRWGKNIYENTNLFPMTSIPFFAMAERRAQYMMLALSKMKADSVFNRYKPYDTEVSDWENVFLNEGINTIWNLVTAQGGETNYSNANARIGVGDSTVAASATQTGLQGTSTAFKAMDTGYPTAGSSQQAVFRGTFADADAVFAWNEETVDNGATPNKNLCRKVTALGTKPNNETWVLRGTLVLS